MLSLYRRHVRKCPADSRENLRCQCPIWMDWTSGSTRLQKSLGIRDWQAAQRRARDMEADGIEAYSTVDRGALTVRRQPMTSKPTRGTISKRRHRSSTRFCYDG